MPERLGEGSIGVASSASRSPLPASPVSLRWHLLIEPRGRTGADNMSLDQALLDDVAARPDGTAYLRLYRWYPPCLSFGRHEPALTRYDRTAIERLGLDVVRRPTGGRAVWHEHEVTYAVAAPIAAFGSLQASYLAIHRRLAAALRSLGVPAELATTGERAPGPDVGPCFAQPVGGEVIIRAQKVVGSAQVRQGEAFLQHGSILLAGAQDVVTRVSRRASAVTRATSLSTAAGREVTFQEVTDAVSHHWLEPSEQWVGAPAVLPFSRPAGFASSLWTWRR